MAVSETISKTPSKGGRPGKFEPKMIAMLRGLFPEIATTRGLQDKDYCIRATGLLQNNRAYRWLIDPEPARMGVKKAYKTTILSALGRISNDARLREAARWLCKEKPDTRRAVAVLRRFRTNRTTPGKPMALVTILARAVDGYCENHPGTTADEVRRALKMVGGMYDGE